MEPTGEVITVSRAGFDSTVEAVEQLLAKVLDEDRPGPLPGRRARLGEQAEELRDELRRLSGRFHRTLDRLERAVEEACSLLRGQGRALPDWLAQWSDFRSLRLDVGQELRLSRDGHIDGLQLDDADLQGKISDLAAELSALRRRLSGGEASLYGQAVRLWRACSALDVDDLAAAEEVDDRYAEQ